MRYTVTNRASRYFEVFNESGDLLGSLSYNTWRPGRAVATLAGGTEYKLAATGFWQTSMEMTMEGMAFIQIKPDWGRGLKVSLPGHAHPFIFKKRSFWNSDYALFDTDGNEIAFVLVNFKWSKFGFDYDLEVHPNNLDKEINRVLPLLMLYCTRYVRMRHAAAT